MSQPGHQRVQIEFHGRPLTVETGRMARQAGGAALVQFGESVVLVTATALTTAREGIDFFPLTCDYQEKTFAAGKIPGGFFKREGRPAEKEILTSRLIDRPLRPLFPKGFNCETQVIATVLSHDKENDPDVLSLLGASTALVLSDIPWNGPIAAVRLGEGTPERAPQVATIFDHLKKDVVREAIVQQKRRLDGRGLADVRPITCEVEVLPRTHGSALFTRGETQALVVATLGTSSDEQKIDALIGETYKKFMLHYNFPPFSTGEVKFLRSPGRREIGHGALAERALAPILPGEEEFPYTIRIVSEILESNGSSSMATVCGGSLALMDGGVPIKAPVAGVAMGR